MAKLVLFALNDTLVQDAVAVLKENEKKLSEMGVQIVYKSRDDMINLEVPEEQVCACIVPSFKDVLFQKLMEKKLRIWSHHLVYHCLSQCRGLPKEPLVLHSLAFEKITLSLSGMSREKKAELTEMVERMGGYVSPGFFESTQLLVAETLDTSSQKYLAACVWRKPIVRPEIITAIWNQGSMPTSLSDPKFLREYQVPVFKGCVICTSGFSPQERTLIGQLVEMHGGKYVIEMVKNQCTHLVVVQPVGEKYKFAGLWGVKVVTPAWLRKCIENNLRFHERKFHPDPEKAKKSTSTKSCENKEAKAPLKTQN